jgi:hypothetical protein
MDARDLMAKFLVGKLAGRVYLVAFFYYYLKNLLLLLFRNHLKQREKKVKKQ